MRLFVFLLVMMNFSVAISSDNSSVDAHIQQQRVTCFCCQYTALQDYFMNHGSSYSMCPNPQCHAINSFGRLKIDTTKMNLNSREQAQLYEACKKAVDSLTDEHTAHCS
jgi:hypothetical protein